MHSECSKVGYYQSKINIFFINQQSKLCAKFFSKINPDAHFGTKINTFTLKEDRGGGGGGLKKMLKLKKCKKNRGFTFFIPGANPVMMLIQFHARGSGIFFIKMVQYGAFLVFQNILRRKSLVSTDTVCNNFVRQP